VTSYLESIEQQNEELKRKLGYAELQIKNLQDTVSDMTPYCRLWTMHVFGGQKTQTTMPGLSHTRFASAASIAMTLFESIDKLTAQRRKSYNVFKIQLLKKDCSVWIIDFVRTAGDNWQCVVYYRDSFNGKIYEAHSWRQWKSIMKNRWLKKARGWI
jgi:hypothetical protein